MAVRIYVEDADRIRDVGRRLKEAGDTKVYRAMVKGIRTAVKPAVDDVRSVVRALPIQGQGSRGRGSAVRARAEYQLSRRRSRRRLRPAAQHRLLMRIRSRSGLRESVARAIGMNIRAAGKPTAVVRIRVDANMMPPGQRKLPRALNAGYWRHPVFGNRERWVGQTSEAGWWQKTLNKRGPHVRNEIDKSVSEVMDGL